MAREALSLNPFGISEDGEAVPAPTDPASLAAEAGAFVAPVEGRPAMVCDEGRVRSVKKTFTFPYWLYEEAARRHANFSPALQEAQ